MNKIILPILIAVFLLGCHGKKKKGSSDEDAASADVVIPATMKDLSAERQIYQLLCQRWVNKEDQQQYDNSDGTGKLNFPYRSLHFFSDLTIVKDPYQGMSFGRWIFNEADKTIHIQYENGEKETYIIKAIGAKNMIFVNEENPKYKIEMVGDGLAEKNPKDDPFYYTNELWRIKPKHLESEDEIKERLRQCIHFYHLYLQDNTNRNESSIMFQGLPSCFVWYSGGIGIRDKENMDSMWDECFFNDEQAMHAYSIMKELNDKDYNWKKDTEETNWVKQATPVLQQMCDSLK